MMMSSSIVFLVSYFYFIIIEKIDLFKVPSKCQNAVDGIDSLSKCFERRYDACPAFFMGSLRDACQVAFSPTISEEVRS